jgi:anti-anti-sigma factor
VISTPVPALTHILVGRVEEAFWLRVEGKGTFQNSLQVKEAIQKAISKGSHQIVVDLERCPIMDSTFLGTLTGAAISLREVPEGKLSVINANPRNLQLMSSLGLDFILEVDSDGSKWSNHRRQASSMLGLYAQPANVDRQNQAEHVLEAHQVLADISPDNQCRFQDVIEFLEKEVGDCYDG